MTNLIFDLNNIVHRSLFIVGGYGSKSFTFDSQSEIDQLMRKMAMDIAFIVRNIRPSRIILCQDESSWRKDIIIDENEGYKGNRVKSKIINWTNVYNAVDEFTEIMQTNGMVVTKIPKAEADDLVALWSQELLFEHKQNVIIVSGDEDIRQLVRTYEIDNINPLFTTVYNPFMQGKNASRKLYVPEKFETWLNTADAVDFLNMKNTINIDKEDFKKISTAERTKIEVIDGNMIAMRKIFCGDDGDNIPAFHTWLNDKDATVRITNSKFLKIYEELLKSTNSNIIDHNILLENVEKLKDAFIKVLQFNPTFDIEQRLKRQINLVVLDPKLFPKSIVNKFQNIKNEELKKPRANYTNLNMYNLLEGTRYIHEKTNENEASIFKKIDRIQGKKLF